MFLRFCQLATLLVCTAASLHAQGFSIEFTDPASNAEAVPRGTDIKVRCTSDIGNIYHPNAVSVHGSYRGKRNRSRGFNYNFPREFAILADQPQPAGEEIEVTLTSEITDQSGNALKPHVFKHRIAATKATDATFETTNQELSGIRPYLTRQDYGVAYLATGDIDGDGDIDIVEAGDRLGYGYTARAFIYQNDGRGCFSTGYYVDENFYTGTTDITLADMTGNGFLDIVESTDDDSVHVYVNDGAGIFTEIKTIHFSPPAWSTVICLDQGDLDGDGDLDLAVGFNDGVRICVNDGAGNLTPVAHFNESVRIADLELGDYDNDGDLDVLHVSEDNAGEVWYNDGSGVNWSSGPGFGDPAEDIGCLKLGDFNNDGLLDIVVSKYRNASHGGEVYFNASSGMPSIAFHDAGGSAPLCYDVEVGDFNADGFLDALLCNAREDQNLVYLNDGTGNLSSDSRMVNPNVATRYLVDGAVADFDGDGDMDFVAGYGPWGDGFVEGDPQVVYNDGKKGPFFGAPVEGKSVFVLDRSLSMEARDIVGPYKIEDWNGDTIVNPDRFQIMQTEAIYAIHTLAEESEFAVIDFGGDLDDPNNYDADTDNDTTLVHYYPNLVTATSQNKLEAENYIASLEAFGRTPTYTALYRACTVYGDELDQILLLTDGDPARDTEAGGEKSSSQVRQDFSGWYADLKANGCELYCIFIGFHGHSGEQFMQDLASDNDGTYIWAYE